MEKKYVKDGKHNKFPAYCCEDIDALLGELVEAVEALVAGTVPDGSVTLAKLADDARSYVREINKGRLISEWIGTKEEYDAHIAENGGKPLPNVRYSIEGGEKYAQVVTDEYPVGSVMSVRVECEVWGADKFRIGDTIEGKLESFTNALGQAAMCFEYKESGVLEAYAVAGKWRCCGLVATDTSASATCQYYIFQRIE